MYAWLSRADTMAQVLGKQVFAFGKHPWVLIIARCHVAAPKAEFISKIGETLKEIERDCSNTGWNSLVQKRLRGYSGHGGSPRRSLCQLIAT